MRREWSERERWWLLGGGIVLLVLLFVLLIVLPYLRKLDRLDTRIAKAREQLETLQEMQPEVTRLRAATGRHAGGSSTASATVVVENTASSLKLRDRLVALRPQTVAEQGPIAETLEVKVEKVQLEELVRWLYALEKASGSLQTSELRLRKRFDDPERFDATLQVVRYRPGDAS